MAQIIKHDWEDQRLKSKLEQKQIALDHEIEARTDLEEEYNSSLELLVQVEERLASTSKLWETQKALSEANEARWKGELASNEARWKGELASNEARWKGELASNEARWKDELASNEARWKDELASNEARREGELAREQRALKKTKKAKWILFLLLVGTVWYFAHDAITTTVLKLFH